jgi:hypothetical protein
VFDNWMTSYGAKPTPGRMNSSVVDLHGILTHDLH